MGNRGTVVFTDGKKAFSPAIYLHWNGGPESIYAFLEELDRRRVRADQDYEAARFCQIVGDFFDQERLSGLSLGLANSPRSDKLTDLAKIKTDLGDNGLYLVNRTNGSVNIRRFHENWENHTMVEMAELDVVRERQAAKTHKYAASFRDLFSELTKGKDIES